MTNLGSLGGVQQMVSNLRDGMMALAVEKISVERKIDEAVEQSEAERQYLKDSFDMMLASVGQFTRRSDARTEIA